MIIKLNRAQNRCISRSEAREILLNAKGCSILVFDYEKVPMVGQAFADEVYRVFKEKYKDIEIQNINMSEGVKFMVERAKNEAKK